MAENDSKKIIKFTIANHREPLGHLQHEQSLFTEFLRFGKKQEEEEEKKHGLRVQSNYRLGRHRLATIK